MSLQRRAAPGTDPQPRPSGLDLPGLDWASVSREADIAHLGLPWGVRGTRRRKCFLSAWRGAGAPRGDGDPAHGQAVWGRGLEPPVSGLNSVHSAENRGVWPTVSTRISCGYRSGAARSKPRSCGVMRGVKPGGRKESPWDLGSEAFRPQAVCTCCSLCPGAAPGSPAPSAGGSPACVSCECQGRARGGRRSVRGLGRGRAPQLSSSGSREAPAQEHGLRGIQALLGFGVPSPQCRAL